MPCPACAHAPGLAQRFARQDFLTLRIIGRLQRPHLHGDMVMAIILRNQRCQDYPAVPALQAVPPKTAKPLSNAPVMLQYLLHQKKRASGPFPSKTLMAAITATAPIAQAAPMDCMKSTTQATTSTQAIKTMPAIATPNPSKFRAARPISDRLLTGWLPCLFFASCAAPASPPQTPARQRQGPSVHQAAVALPRRQGR